MICYEFKCVKCGRITELYCSIADYTDNKRGMRCCGDAMEPVISGGRMSFLREGFPKGTAITEHCTDEPVFCKDKVQLKDICDANDAVSRYVEDDM